MTSENIFKELVELKKESDRLRLEIQEAREPFDAMIEKIKEEMANALINLNARDAAIDERITAIKADFNVDWIYPDLIYQDKESGIKVQRRKSETPEVVDAKALLKAVLQFDELPIKAVNWDNRKLITLAEAGVIGQNLVAVQKTYTIALTFPKEGE